MTPLQTGSKRRLEREQLTAIAESIAEEEDISSIIDKTVYKVERLHDGGVLITFTDGQRLVVMSVGITAWTWQGKKPRPAGREFYRCISCGRFLSPYLILCQRCQDRYEIEEEIR